MEHPRYYQTFAVTPLYAPLRVGATHGFTLVVKLYSAIGRPHMYQDMGYGLGPRVLVEAMRMAFNFYPGEAEVVNIDVVYQDEDYLADFRTLNVDALGEGEASDLHAVISHWQHTTPQGRRTLG